MRLDWAMLSDAASSRDNLAFIIGGGIDTLGSTPVQAGQPAEAGQVGTPVVVAVPFRLLFARAELGRMHNFEILTTDEDGAEVARIQATFFAPPNPVLEPGWDQPVVLSFGLQIAPRRFGRYSVEIFGDGAHLKSIPFRIIEVAAPAPPPQ